MSMEINEMQEMNERAKKALEYHKKGYNCSQAVACSFCICSNNVIKFQLPFS